MWEDESCRSCLNPVDFPQSVLSFLHSFVLLFFFGMGAKGVWSSFVLFVYTVEGFGA